MASELETVDRGTEYQLPPQREKFAQLRAMGKEPIDAYWLAYHPDEGETPTDPDKRNQYSRYACTLGQNTTVRLRIQELQRPAIRRMRHKLEYTVQSALRQCQVAYELAYADGDVNGILKCVEMQAKLSKLLSEEINVNHKHGLLDDASTATLLAMKAAFDKANQNKRLAASVVSVESVPGPPMAPLSS